MGLGGAVDARALRYDLVTALLALGQHDRGAEGRLAPRLALLLTARFNWRSGAFAVGQREIARLWGVTERTAKREMGAMREMGWIVVRRPAARGRVTEHGLDLLRLRAATRSIWAAVGPDFEARMMMGQGAAEETSALMGATVVPFPRTEAETMVPSSDSALWPRALALLHEEDPAICAAWLSRLRLEDWDGARMTLAAPSTFVAGYVEMHYRARLLAVLRALDPAVREVRVAVG